MDRDALIERLEASRRSVSSMPETPERLMRRLRIDRILGGLYGERQSNNDTEPPVPRRIHQLMITESENAVFDDREYSRKLCAAIRAGLDEESRIGYSDHFRSCTSYINAVLCTVELERCGEVYDPPKHLPDVAPDDAIAYLRSFETQWKKRRRAMRQ